MSFRNKLYASCIFLATIVGCQCNNSTQPTNSTLIPARHKGIWHTGIWSETIPQPTSDDKKIAQLCYNHTFQLYKVKHDGSCGYRSFIPILLDAILVGDKWKLWLNMIRTQLYEPAKAILQPLNLAGSKYEAFRPTDNPGKLLQDTESLLQQLSQEAEARPLQEAEIALLVDFLRQTVLMEHIIAAEKGSVERNKLEPQDPNVIIWAIDKFFLEPNFNQKSFWAFAGTFRIFYVPYMFLGNQSDYHNIHYFFPNNFSNLTRKEEVSYEFSPYPIVKGLPKQAPRIWLYHHNNYFFEYLVCE